MAGVYDLIGTRMLFLAEKCDVEPGNSYKRVGSTALFEAWSAYARSSGADPGKQAGFVQKMKRQHFEQRREANFRGFVGICLQPMSLDRYGGD
ncbi:hypothetical protein [Methylobacterium nigriterrae]|uniref:hypothetical protein n=1 Tax=Methylobacterium nigriterrae TaxID=3127512 RepID=UPI003013DAD8